MDLEELKNTWQNLNIRVSQLEEDNRRTANALSAGRAGMPRQPWLRCTKCRAAPACSCRCWHR